MHRRIAASLAGVERTYSNPYVGRNFQLFERFSLYRAAKVVLWQESAMIFGGISFPTVFVIGLEGKPDSYGGIVKIDEEQVQLMKRRGGVGHDLSHLRPKGTPVKNSALTSTGLVLSRRDIAILQERSTRW